MLIKKMPKNNLKMSVTLLSQFDPNLQRIYYTCFEDTYYFNSNLLLNSKKLPRVWNRLIHGAGVSHVGLFWSYTFNYSITLIYFLSGWLFHKSWAKQRVSLIKFAKLKWATEEKIMTLWYGPWGIILTHDPIENHNKTDMCWAG